MLKNKPNFKTFGAGMAASGKGRGENWEKVALFYEMVEGKCNITYLVLLTTQTGLQKLTGVRGKKNK